VSIPEDFEAERSLIATFAAEGSLTPGAGTPYAHQAFLALRIPAFLAPEHRHVFATMQAVYQRGDEITPLVIKAEMDQLGTLSQVGGWQSLVELFSSTETGRPDKLAEVVIRRWKARQVMQLAYKASKAVEDLEAPDAVSSRMQVALAEIFSDGTNADVRRGTEILAYVGENRPFRDISHAEKLVWFGFDTIDEAVEASPGHVVIVAARPGMGKTALAVQGSILTAKRQGMALIISLEMDHDEVFSRIAARLTETSASIWRKGMWSEYHAKMLHSRADILDRINIWAHPSGVPWERIEAVVRDQVRRDHVTSVWLDYFTLIKKPDGKSNDAGLWGQVSSNIKRLAQELKICIVLLCQLNREGAEVEPKLSDLRETGQLEQDANAVVMLWPKDAKAMESRAEIRSVFVKLAKNRSGQAGWRVELAFNGAQGYLRTLERNT